jgi:hypothetical protein
MNGGLIARAAVSAALAYAVLGGAGCAGWKAKATATLAATHEASKAVTKVAHPGWDLRCSTKAKACKAAGDTTCAPLVECEKQFREFNDAIRAVESTIAAALALISLGQEADALSAVLAAGVHLKRVYDLARQHGVLKWKP